MTITFDTQDRERVASRLADAGLEATEERITNVLIGMEEAIQENCYNDEMDYFVQEEAE